jgi:hypothetical protein
MISKEEGIRMAREAGAAPYTNRHYPDRTTHTFSPNQLERFIALIASKECEACAQIADISEPYQSADKIRERKKMYDQR